MQIKKVGVVGAGVMGAGIAQVCAQSGYQTVVSEINQQLLDKGLGTIKTSLAKSVEKGKLTQSDMEATLARLKGTLNTQDFKDCDLIIEAAIENMELKKKLFADLDKICPPQTILGTNTSALSVTEIAMATKRPEKVAGIHFFNPPSLMKLVELVITIVTSNETIDTIKAFGQSIGKTVVLAKDAPGFIVNRLFVPYLLDSIRMLEANYATKEDIDQAAKLGLNYPMGPLELSDLIGLDTLHFVASVMYEEYKDPKFVSPVLLKKMVAAGQLGRKTGKGFYEYK